MSYILYSLTNCITIKWFVTQRLSLKVLIISNRHTNLLGVDATESTIHYSPQIYSRLTSDFKIIGFSTSLI